MTAAAMPPETVETALANERARFAILQKEWHAFDAALAAKTNELRVCGLRVSELERAATPDLLPGYNENGGCP